MSFVRFIVCLLILAINPIALSADPDAGRQECLIEIQSILNLKEQGASPFSILRVPPGSPADVVTSRYRELSKMFHPDQNPHGLEGDDLKRAQEAFVAATEARKAIESQTQKAANFMDFLTGSYQRRTWVPLFPLKVGKDTGIKKNSDVWRGHDSTARYFVWNGKAPAITGDSIFGNPRREGRGVFDLVTRIAEGHLAPDSPYFSSPTGLKSQLYLKDSLMQNLAELDEKIFEYLRQKPSKMLFSDWSQTGAADAQRIEKEDRFGLKSWFRGVLGDFWTVRWIGDYVPIRFAGVLMQTDEFRVIGGRLAIYELTRAKDFDHFVELGKHLPRDIWEQAKTQGLAEVRNNSFPVVGAALDGMEFLQDWTAEMQQKAINEILKKKRRAPKKQKP